MAARTKRRKQARRRSRSRRRMRGGMLNEQQQQQLIHQLRNILQTTTIESINPSEANRIATEVENEVKINTEFKKAVRNTLGNDYDSFINKCMIDGRFITSIRGAQRIIALWNNIIIST